jgi:hypothetical protein
MFTADDLGVLGSLGKATGFLTSGGDPDSSWFGAPEDSLKTMLSDDGQREALIAFVDDALGGADRTTEDGVVWLPVVSIGDPHIDVYVTVDERRADWIAIGVGIAFTTESPVSRTTASIPLFRAARTDSGDAMLLLGDIGGRLRLATSITIDEPEIGSVGVELDIPTHPDDDPPVFGLTITDLQLPGASAPTDLSVSATGVDDLDDAMLDLVLSLVKAQAAGAAGEAIAALAGLLGLAGDDVPDFPVEQLASQGVSALAAWLRDVIDDTSSRQAWLDHVADLIEGNRVGDAVEVDLGPATLRLGVIVDTGPSGNVRITPTLTAIVGDDDARVEASAHICRVDLVTGEALALPSLGVWAAVGSAGNRVLDLTNPTVARADTLRVGFALDADRRLTFVLAADQVRLGTRDYPVLDLTSPDAVMDAAGNAVEDVAEELLGNLGDALATAQVLIGLDAPPGHPAVPTITLGDLLGDPLAAIAGYWQTLMTDHADAVGAVLLELRNAIADASEVVGSVIDGTGTATDPWRVPLAGPLALEASITDDVVTIAIAAATSVDTLGQRCTVVETRIAATLAEIDLGARTASLLTGATWRLTARERGVTPPRVTLVLGEDVSLSSGPVGVRLDWTVAAGLSAAIEVPDPTLTVGGDSFPVPLPVIEADGSVSLDADGWDAVQELIGRLAVLLPGTVGDIVSVLGWSPRPFVLGAELRLADLVDDPAAALATWLPQLALSELGPDALAFLADLLSAAGDVSGAIAGSGHPDDPYRLPIGAGLPEPAVWFPPAGLEPRVTAVPDALARWRPGDPGLSPEALEEALRAEGQVAADVADMVRGRSIAAGLAAVTARWVGGDGRIAPPATAPTGVTIVRAGHAAGQLLSLIDLETELDRVPTTVVYVDLGAAAWADRAADRRIDLTAPGLAPTMFTPPAAATGEWFVALGPRAACKLATGDADGTAGQAARLGRVLDNLAPLGNDLVVVALAGAGHAARVAVDAQGAVSDLILVGTPLGPVSLSALTNQPTADALRLLHALLPPTDVAEGDADDPDDEDLALGRHLVEALVGLRDLADPAVDLRPAIAEPPAVRAGLTVSAWFGVVSADQVARAITAVLAAGLADHARQRELAPIPPPSGVFGGLVLTVAPNAAGTLRVEADARLTLVGFDRAAGLDLERELRVRVWISDRLGWLIATPEQELRFVSIDATIPLGGGAGPTPPGTATITLHDARVLGQSWERLVVGTGPGELPLLPEARLLLATAIQRLVADAAANPLAASMTGLGEVLGLIVNGGAVHDAFDQLVHDSTGLVGTALATRRPELSVAITELLGPVAASIDLDAKTVRVEAGGADAGPFGWIADVTISPTNPDDPITGTTTFGPDAATATATATGGLEVAVDLAPFAAEVRWHQPGGTADVAELWPAPDGDALARLIAKAAPSLGAHIALEVMRRADDAARPVIDAALDALGMLAGLAGDADRAIRPLAGFISDPAGWLRSAESIAAQPAKAQALFDALRPLLGIAGAPGDPISFVPGVALAVAADGPDVRIELSADSSAFTAPGGAEGRLVGGVTAALTIGATGPPRPSLGLHVGLDSDEPGAEPGRQAIHASLGAAGIAVFLRPTTGADIPLLPFAGLGGLAAAAEAALPFLLDRLAEIPGDVGDTVATVGDALAVRTGSGAARHFDGPALVAWAVDPVGSLTGALPTIVATGLATIAPLVDGITPPTVSVTATANEVSVTVEGITLSWAPASDQVTIGGSDIEVPGIESLTFAVTISPTGIDALTITVGPAAIDAGGVVIQPYVQVAAGNSPPGGTGIAVGLAVSDTSRVAIRWLLDPISFSIVAGDGPLAGIDTNTDPADVATRIVEIVLDVVAAVAIATDAVQDMLQIEIGSSTVGDVLQDVLLDGTGLVDGIFDPDTLLARALTLFENLAGADLAVTFEGLTLSLIEQDDVIGLQLGLAERLELVSGDVTLWLENDDSWIDDNPGGEGGIFVGAVTIDGTDLSFAPTLAVNGVGLRVGKLSGPLLDFGITIESIALHTFAEIGLASGDITGAGVQLQLTGLAVSADGASGGNGIAAGIVADTGPQPPKPTFSPALAIQQHDDNPVHVTLRAGDGSGPWWIAIQKGFGPLYLEQIGFGVEMPSQRVDSVSLFLDGSVSLFGLTCAVDDLQITYLVSKDDFFNPASWEIDLAGLAVSADMSGVTIAGGLLKAVSSTGDIEYLGMLLGRFGVYGITIYGGYGEGTDPDTGQSFVAFFAIGAVVGPIGGPPAFFLTGIGGGFGINRALVVPTDLSQFGTYPLIQALDVAASPGNPMEQLRSLGAFFPMEQGTFWFAAGVSFTSFVIVEGIAVVAVEIGDGLDINLLGLARVALPRPEVALVSIELALVVRFSSSEGVLWVQGQLTDNSWLLYRDVRLTGGFAFVIWFKGPNAGQFVLTMGGFHPDFHRDGYPEVPRLGIQWSVSSAIVIKAGGYFALTSEAVMAGGDFEASAHFGPAWAEVKFGAHGIVFFDPFHYSVMAYASIAAGITIDTWLFGEITISISIGARIEVEGPDFHGKATFEVGPVELEVEFGSSDKHVDPPLSASDFIDKYLDRGVDGGAQAITVITTFGAQPSGSGAPTPDGKPDRPFIVVAEFGLILTTVVPASRVVTVSPSGVTLDVHNPSRTLGVAPMDSGSMTPQVTLSWAEDGGGALDFPFVATARPFGSFPVGVWGPPQDSDNRPMPKGDVIEALCELDLSATATIGPGTPPIPYYQVEINDRRPLPFTLSGTDVGLVRNAGTRLTALLAAPADVDAAFAVAGEFLSLTASPTALAALRGERQAPPMVGTLGEGLDTLTNTVIPVIGDVPTRRVVDTFVYPARAVALLPSSGAVSLGDASRAGARTRTTVKGSGALWRTTPPTLAEVEADRSVSIATGLVVVEPPATVAMRTSRSGTLIATGDIPPSETGRAAPALVASRGSEATGDLRAFSEGLRARRRVRRGAAGAVLGPGDVVVLALPNSRRDVDEQSERPRLGVQGNGARIVAVADGGRVIDDQRVIEAWPIASGTDRIVAIGLGAPDEQRPLSSGGLAGWHANAQLPYVGWSTAVGAGCTVQSRGEPIRPHRQRAGAGWVTGAEMARGVSTVTTRFVAPITAVVIVIDDPNAFGDTGLGRELALVLGGASRATDASGAPRPPVVLTSEQRNVVAYDVVPQLGEGREPVTVTVASDAGWSLAGVLGAAGLGAEAAIAIVTARGLDAAVDPVASGGRGFTRLEWLGPTEPPAPVRRGRGGRR